MFVTDHPKKNIFEMYKSNYFELNYKKSNLRKSFAYNFTKYKLFQLLFLLLF